MAHAGKYILALLTSLCVAIALIVQAKTNRQEVVPSFSISLNKNHCVGKDPQFLTVLYVKGRFKAISNSKTNYVVYGVKEVSPSIPIKVGVHPKKCAPIEIAPRGIDKFEGETAYNAVLFVVHRDPEFYWVNSNNPHTPSSLLWQTPPDPRLRPYVGIPKGLEQFSKDHPRVGFEYLNLMIKTKSEILLDSTNDDSEAPSPSWPLRYYFKTD